MTPPPTVPDRTTPARPVAVTPRLDPQTRRAAYVRTAAETAACTCPEACERDHGND